MVLDLARDPARTDFPPGLLEGADGEEGGPLLRDEVDVVVVFLGEHAERRWHLVVDGVSERSEPLERRAREDILFLAGECAGLLFFREFAQEGAAPDEDDDGED